MSALDDLEWRTERARVASLSRSRPDTDPELIRARQRMYAARLKSHIKELVDKAPPFTDEQRDEIVSLIMEGAA